MNNLTKGYVNFPIDNEKYENSNEGGMAVQILIPYNEKVVCCNDVCFYYEPIFPVIYNNPLSDYFDKPFIGVLTIGSANWSGWYDEVGKYFNCVKYWECTEDDLTNEGKLLFNLIKKIYPDAFLLTLLDT